MNIVVNASSVDSCGQEGKSCIEYGAFVFQERCSLCHGSDGLGEGILPLSLKNYPSTNLLIVKHAKTVQKTREIITFGGGLDYIESEMPPWGDELTVSQLSSVVMFIDLLKSDMESALTAINSASKKLKSSSKLGRSIYQGRCALCHGKYGQGNGKMARIIKSPPPFNLTLSRAPDAYLKDIIFKGGEAMSRSPRMPPWEGTLTTQEIDSVILFIKTLRK